MARLYDAGVFVNTALHPAVPPGGALLRTSVMATHDRATLDRALDAFASVKAPSRPSTVRCRRPVGRLTERPSSDTPACPILHKSGGQEKAVLFANLRTDTR